MKRSLRRSCSVDSQIKIKRLIRQGFSYLGMIDEARSRCVLLKQKFQKNQSDFLFESNDKFDAEMGQIRMDLSKYSRKLKRIHKELEENGAFSKLE
jgi:uncharacterized protein YukE